MANVQGAMSTDQCSLFIVQRAMFIILCSLFIVQCAMLMFKVFNDSLRYRSYEMKQDSRT